MSNGCIGIAVEEVLQDLRVVAGNGCDVVVVLGVCVGDALSVEEDEDDTYNQRDEERDEQGSMVAFSSSPSVAALKSGSAIIGSAIGMGASVGSSLPAVLV